MRVRGHFPLGEDRPLRLPIQWQAWMPEAGSNNGNGSDDGGEDDDHDDDHTDGNIRDGYADDNHPRRGGTVRGRQGVMSDIHHSLPSGSSPQCSGLRYDISPKAPRSTPPPKFLIFTNPFANVVELEALKRDFAQQPNWKASLVEGESWEGTTEENIAKYQKLVAQ
jgi:hypothetical protein